MSLPLENNQLPPEEVSGDAGGTAFMAVIGAIAGGTPQLLISTATLVELLGNTVMGAILVAVVDTMLVRRTLKDDQLRKGRMLLILFVAVTLTVVTYHTAGGIFQQVFNFAPDPAEFKDLSAAAYTHNHIGNVAYRLSFTADPVALKKITDEMEHIPSGTVDIFDPVREPFATYIRRVLPEDADHLPSLADPQGFAWSSAGATPLTSARVARTVLLRDKSTGKCYVHHLAG